MNVEGADRRVIGSEQRLADGRHVDGARREAFGVRVEIGRSSAAVSTGNCRRSQHRTAGRLAPGADQRRQAMLRTAAAAGAAVETVVEADHARPVLP